MDALYLFIYFRHIEKIKVISVLLESEAFIKNQRTKWSLNLFNDSDFQSVALIAMNMFISELDFNFKFLRSLE